MDKRDARGKIEELVTFFGDNIYQLKSPNFNETQARQQLIDPFFEALGWDVRNRSMKPLFMQEVVPEGRVKTKIGREISEQPELFKPDDADSQYKEYRSILDYIAEDEYKASSKEAIKKPDYRFRINGQTKFFVEAKKPFVDLSKSQGAIFQVKRYGFSGRVPVSILTDFEQFRVFDCTQRPEYSRPKIGIIKEFDLSYLQYSDKFELLYDTFSRDAVQGGSLDTLAKKQMQKRTGDFALDRAFLDDLSKWREELARDIAKHPKNRRKLNDYTLNESVQRILDRIVFFRVCEDREIEVENTLLAILQMWKSRPGMSLYSLLTDLFKQRRALYNGLLFSPHECEELEVGDDVLIKILQNLNYPFSPYHFNEIGVEILGSIYEKFLGKTIHLTPKTTRIEEKPEVRKAGGVYYTPQYIVNYIVDNTLGKLLYEDASTPVSETPSLSMTKEKQPSHPERTAKGGESKDEREGFAPESQPKADPPPAEKDDPSRKLRLTPKQVSNLKIIDIACGSGSFLLGAFQKLIDYHLEWYTLYPKDIKTVQHVPDAYKDANGSLHLSARKKRDILVNNLYGVDIDRQAVEVTQMSLYMKVLEGENADTITPQMTLALKEVYLPSLTKNIKCGNSLIGTDFVSQGDLFDEETQHKVNPFDWEAEFSVIINNGGFDCVIGNPPWGAEFDEQELEYLREKNRQIIVRMIDSFMYFVYKGIQIVRKNGYFGMILPDVILYQKDNLKLREYMIEECSLGEIINLGNGVFEKVTRPTCILTSSKGSNGKNIVKLADLREDCEILRKEIIPWSNIKQSQLSELPDKVFPTSDIDDYKILKKAKRVRQNELNYYLDEDGIQRGVSPDLKEAFVVNNSIIAKQKLEKTHLRDVLTGGKEVKRYGLVWEKNKIIYTNKDTDFKSIPHICSFIDTFRNEITCVEVKQGKHPLYALHRSRNENIFLKKEKVLGVITEDEIKVTIDDEQYYATDGLYLFSTKNANAKFITGILNSRFFVFLYRLVSLESGRVLAQVKPTIISRLPIRAIDFDNSDERKMHDDLVSLVEKMLELNRQLQPKEFDSEREPIERQIAATDKKIDELVYQLYGLTDEEIRIVEGK